MSLRKRVQKIETSLTPKEMALFWLMEIQKFGQQRCNEDMWADPRRLRGAVAKKTGEAVRENLGDPPLNHEKLEEAVREAQKQTDTLMGLILDVHEHVRSESRINHVCVELVLEKYLHLLERHVYHGECEPQAWDSWRAMLIKTWTATIRLRKLVDSISETYFDGHALLFPEDEELLKGDNADLESMAKIYNRPERDLPNWKSIDIDAELSLIAEFFSAEAEHLVSMAKVKTLDAFGERDAAGKLLDSCEYRMSRELKRLRSLSRPQEKRTC